MSFCVEIVILVFVDRKSRGTG